MKWRDSVNSGCKVNLRLKVTGKRPDGLHDLAGCFCFLPFPGDIISITAGEKEGVSLDCPGFPELSGSQNLAYRAAESFAQASGIMPSWHIVVEKKIPIAAGLGGGSADAGAVLTMLNRHYRSFSGLELKNLAFTLGADIPFFIENRTAWVTGAGECIEFPENLPEIPEIVIVNPGFPVSAKWAYTHLDKKYIGQDDPQIRADFESGKVDWRKFCCNDLAFALMNKFPLLRMMENSLYDLGAIAVQISGSGPSIVGLFEKDSSLAAENFRKNFSGMHGLRIFAGGKEF